MATKARFTEAIVHLRRAVELDPKRVASRLELGMAHHDEGRRLDGLEQRAAAAHHHNAVVEVTRAALALSRDQQRDDKVAQLGAHLKRYQRSAALADAEP